MSLVTSAATGSGVFQRAASYVTTTRSDRATYQTLLDAAGQPIPAEQAWEQYCQVLLCANEFVYVE